MLNELDLAWNGLGDDGAQEIGACLMTNSTLVSLNLSNNAIKGTGAVVLASGLNNNTRLKQMRLQGNPIGRAGAKYDLVLRADHENCSDVICVPGRSCL